MERRDFIKLIPGIVAGVAAGPLTSLASAGAKPELDGKAFGLWVQEATKQSQRGEEMERVLIAGIVQFEGEGLKADDYVIFAPESWKQPLLDRWSICQSEPIGGDDPFFLADGAAWEGKWEIRFNQYLTEPYAVIKGESWDNMPLSPYVECTMGEFKEGKQLVNVRCTNIPAFAKECFRLKGRCLSS